MVHEKLTTKTVLSKRVTREKQLLKAAATSLLPTRTAIEGLPGHSLPFGLKKP